MSRARAGPGHTWAQRAEHHPGRHADGRRLRQADAPCAGWPAGRAPTTCSAVLRRGSCAHLPARLRVCVPMPLFPPVPPYSLSRAEALARTDAAGHFVLNPNTTGRNIPLKWSSFEASPRYARCAAPGCPWLGVPCCAVLCSPAPGWVSCCAVFAGLHVRRSAPCSAHHTEHPHHTTQTSHHTAWARPAP